MTSNTQTSQKLRRNGSPSTNKASGPLRATIPVCLMSQSVIHDVPEDSHPNSQSVRSKINLPHTVVVTSGNTLQCGTPKKTPWRMKQWSPTPLKVENPEPTQKIDDYPAMRRTASLDAIYLKGQWPRGTVDCSSNLPLDKATQTPEEWVIDLKRFSYRGVESSPSRDRKQKRLFLGHQGLTPPLFQQYSSGSISPNRVASASTNTEHHAAAQLLGSSSDNKKEKSRAIPVPPPTMQSSKARNSVEGFNTEIEKLVCRDNGETTSNKMMEPTPDGHRAPIAELFKRNNSCRSVDTQTPVKAYSTNSSSGTSSPCGSVSPSVWVFDHHHSSSRPPSDGCPTEEIGDYNSLSPEDFQALSLGTSPRNRFLCREPPDGCEKVETLKIVEHPVKNGQDATTLYCSPKPSCQFVLQPSSSSAFCSLNKLNHGSSSFSSATKSNSSSHLFGGGGGGLLHGSNLGEISDRSSSVPPQWPIQQQQQISSAVQMIPATPSGQPI